MTAQGASARHSLESYLPSLLRERLALASPLSAPESSAGAAIVMLSDIAGFTATVERYTEKGRAGLEELTWLLNHYVAAVAGAVAANGGDVLSIAGDAFLCHWGSADDGDRAAGAAADIQRALRAATDPRGVSLAELFPTRIGIADGELITAFVGGLGGRWELVVSGPAIRNVVAAEREAAPGAIVSRLSFRGAQATRGLQPESSQPSGSSLRSERLLPFLPPAIVARGIDGGQDWLAESRPVSVMFSDLPGMMDAGETELARVHAVVRRFQDIVTRLEGTIKVDVDEKGLLLLATFGLPPRAHEDDAARAVHAAEELHRALVDMGTPRGIGVASGRAFCGAFGSDVRRDYMVRGDVINLAARLMHAGDGAVLCDAPTARTAGSRIAFDRSDPIPVRGRSEPVEVFRPRGRVSAPSRHATSVIGRVEELDALNDRIRLSAAGEHAGATVVEGDAGLGKSRLVLECTRRARDAGVRVITASADAIERSRPYHAWRPVVAALLRVSIDDEPRVAREAAERYVAGRPSLERLLPLLSDVYPLQIPDTPLTAEMTGDVRADNTRALLRQMIQIASSADPTMLVVEDAHWLDSGSWALLLDVLSEVRPLCTIVATRPFADPVPREATRLFAIAGERRLVLAGLSPAETARLVADRLGVREVPEVLARFIDERVAGHPFFCEELVRAMVESGVVRIEAETCVVGDLGATSLPTTVEGVIVTRLDRLTPSQQLCLKIASVIGRTFRERLVRDAHPIEEHRPLVSSDLGAIAAADLTAVEAPEPDLAYLFKHVITRDVTYEQMPFAQRQPLHRAVAGWYERNHADDLSPHYSLLAYHWARAADPPKTVEYLEKAGEQALRTGGFREAAVFFAEAMKLADAGEVKVEAVRRALWEKGLGQANYDIGNLVVSRTHIENAVASLHRAVPSSMGRTATATLMEVGRQVRHRLFPRQYLGRRAADHRALEKALECYTTLGQAYFLAYEPPLKMLYVTVTALNAGEEAGTSAALARVMINVSMLAYLVGLSKQSEWYAARALEIAEEHGMSAKGYVWGIRSLTLAQRGAWTSAREADDAANRISMELGDVAMEAGGWSIRVAMDLRAGEIAAAARGNARLRELAELSGNKQHLCWSRVYEADVHLARGDTDRAASEVDAANLVDIPATDGGTSIERNRATAIVRLRQDRHDEAARAAHDVFDAMRKTPPTGYHWADDFAQAVEVYLALLRSNSAYVTEHRAELERRAAEGCKLVRKHSRIFRPVAARAWLLQGMLERHRGRPEAARRALERARAVADEMAHPFERARAELEMARDARGVDRDRLVAAARETFTALDAGHYLGLLSQL